MALLTEWTRYGLKTKYYGISIGILFWIQVTKVDVFTLEEAGPACDCDGLCAEPEPD